MSNIPILPPERESEALRLVVSIMRDKIVAGVIKELEKLGFPARLEALTYSDRTTSFTFRDWVRVRFANGEVKTLPEWSVTFPCTTAFVIEVTLPQSKQRVHRSISLEWLLSFRLVLQEEPIGNPPTWWLVDSILVYSLDVEGGNFTMDIPAFHYLTPTGQNTLYFPHNVPLRQDVLETIAAVCLFNAHPSLLLRKKLGEIYESLKRAIEGVGNVEVEESVSASRFSDLTPPPTTCVGVYNIQLDAPFRPVFKISPTFVEDDRTLSTIKLKVDVTINAKVTLYPTKRTCEITIFGYIELEVDIFEAAEGVSIAPSLILDAPVGGSPTRIKIVDIEIYEVWQENEWAEMFDALKSEITSDKIAALLQKLHKDVEEWLPFHLAWEELF